MGDGNRCDLGFLVVAREGDRVSVTPQKAGARGAIVFGGIGVILWIFVAAVQLATDNASALMTLLPLLGVPLLAFLGWIYKGPAPTFMLEAARGTLRFGIRDAIESLPVADLATFETEYEAYRPLLAKRSVDCYVPVLRRKDGRTIRLMPGVLSLGKRLSDLLCSCLNRSILEGGNPGETPSTPLIEGRFIVACVLGLGFAVAMYFLLKHS